MNIIEAMHKLKEGIKVRRKVWTFWLELSREKFIEIEEMIIHIPKAKQLDEHPTICTPYKAVIDDILADDWEIVEPPAPEAPALKLEVGKLYRTRDGRKAFVSKCDNGGPDSPDDPDEWGYYVVVEGCTVVFRYSAKCGQSVSFCDSGRSSVFDLIAEWVDDPAPPPPLKLEIGKCYRTRDGRKVFVVDRMGGHRDSFEVKLFDNEDKFSYDNYYPDGRYALDDFSDEDIVAEWVDEPPQEEPPEPSPAPAPAKPVVDWTTLPAWANWVAMDSNGEWLWYYDKPRMDEIAWFSYNSMYQVIPSEYAPAFEGDWKDSLRERPKDG